jgi:hypothetical protein
VSSTRQFDLSGLRQTRVKNAASDGADSTPAIARTNLDSSWKSLSDLESHVYKTIPSEHDSKKLDELVQAARKARQSGSEDAYRDAVIDLLNFHLDSHKDTESYTPYDYKSDGFLNPKNMVMINARFRGKSRTGSQPENLNDSYDRQIKEYKASRPDLRSLYSGLSGSWDIKGAKAEADDMYSKGYDALLALGASPAEAEYLSRKKTIDTYKLRSTDQNMASVVVTDGDTGNSIVVHMKIDNSGVMTPKASKDDFAGTAAALAALRAGGLYKGKVTVHLLDDNSKLPNGISGIDANTVAFTYDKADSINVYVDKVAKQIDIAKQHPGYWSTDFKNLTEAHKHFVAHEVGHQLAEQIFGSQNSNEISTEMAKFYNEPSVDDSADSTDSSGEASDAAKAIASAQGASTDLSSWNNTGGAKGSNAGGTWEDPNTGQKVYAKFQKSDLHGQNERLASALYRFLGVDAADIVPGSVNGRDVTYASYVPGVKEDFDSRITNDPAYLKKVQEGFAVDALLANWDATLNDNIVTDANGNPVRIDVGGSLLFRAQGGARGSSFGDDVLELGTYTSGNTNPKAVRVFGSMTQQEQADSAKKLTKLTNSDIDALVDSIVTDSTAAQGLKHTLKKRRDFILGRYGLTGDDSVAARNKAHKASNKIATNNPVPAISTRGADGSAENFAELFAKYVVTGDAPDWFIKLLESRGYAKGKKNTSWRKNVAGTVKAGFLNFIDSILGENDNGNYPERDRSKYGVGTRLGSSSGHRLIRSLGFAGKTAQIVDELDPTWKRVYRGVGSATVEGTFMSTKDMHANFASSPTPYISMTTYYGDGGYSASTYDEAKEYGERSNYRDNSVIEMAVDPKAKVAVVDTGYGTRSYLGFSADPNMLSESQIKSEILSLLKSIIANELEPGEDENSASVISRANSLIKDLPLTSPNGHQQSNMYSLLGYDAIEFNLGSKSYFVILNRGILQVRKRDIT